MLYGYARLGKRVVVTKTHFGEHSRGYLCVRSPSRAAAASASLDVDPVESSLSDGVPALTGHAPLDCGPIA